MADRFTLGIDRDIGRVRGRRMGSLWADTETGEGEVTINEVVDDDLSNRANLLRNWIALLTAEYELTREKVAEDFYRRSEQKIIQFPGRKA